MRSVFEACSSAKAASVPPSTRLLLSQVDLQISAEKRKGAKCLSLRHSEQSGVLLSHE